MRFVGSTAATLCAAASAAVLLLATVASLATIASLATMVGGAAGHKHELVKRLVFKKAYKALKKAPRYIPVVIPLPIMKHKKPSKHDAWKVQEVPSVAAAAAGWDQGWSSSW